jgi:GxxExxY protein
MLEDVGRELVDSAFQVHIALGPGLMESAYEACLHHQLSQRGLTVERQKALPVTYKGLQLDAGFRLDLLIEGQVVVELKAVEALSPLHEAQLLSYLKLGGYRLGFLLNFNTRRMKEGIRRRVNKL